MICILLQKKNLVKVENENQFQCIAHKQFRKLWQSVRKFDWLMCKCTHTIRIESNDFKKLKFLFLFDSNRYIFTIVSYLIGVFIFATIVGQVGNVITNRNANRLEFERLLDGAKTYMRHHKVRFGQIQLENMQIISHLHYFLFLCLSLVGINIGAGWHETACATMVWL